MGPSRPNRGVRGVLPGPIITIAIALGARLFQSMYPGPGIPGLGAILVACVVLSVMRGGWRSGITSGVLATVSYAWLRSNGTWQFDATGAVSLAAELAVTTSVVIGLGRLVSRLDRMAAGERALRDAAEAERARTTAILESISDGFFAIDRAWRYVYMNAQAEKLVGRPREQLLGVSIWDAFPPLVGSPWDRAYRRALDTNEAVHFDAFYPPLDAWFETHAYPSAGGLSIYLRNVTDRIRAEQALQGRVRQQAAIAHVGRLALEGKDLQDLLDEAVARLASVFDVELAKVLECRPDGRLHLRAGVGWQPGKVGSTLVDSATGSQAGYTLLSGQPVIVDDLRTEQRFQGPALLTEHGVISGMSIVIAGRDRPWGILAVHSTRRRAFTGDDVSVLTGMAQVLALALERIHATAELRDNEERFRQLAENLHEVLFVTDVRNQDPGYISPAYGAIWGRSVASWYADPMSWLEAVHPDDRARVEAALAGLGDGRYDEQFRIVQPDGTIRWIHGRAFGVRDDRGLVHRIVGIAEDITVMRRLSEEHAARAAAEEHAARAAAEARVAARDEVLAIVSHDLRNPLSTIDLAVDGLELTGSPGDGRHLQAIRRATRRMARLIQDLLDIARIDAGASLAISRAELDPGSVIESLVERFSLQAERKSITLVVGATPDLPRVVADGDRLLQALENLAGNALKFTPPGGQIWIEASAADGCLRFSISDTGPGIPPESAGRLFERYWQAKTDRRGIGLGLPIVKGIAEAHGGRVWAEPRPGGGTTFRLELPSIAVAPVAVGAPGDGKSSDHT